MRNLIWDLGGTLIDTYPQVDRTLAEAVAAPHPPTASLLAEVRSLRTISIGHAIDALARGSGIPRERFEEAYASLKERWRSRPAPLMAGARALMDAVSAGGGRNLVATHRDRASAEALLLALGVEVDDLVCASDGLARKPDPAMNLLLLARHRLDPAEVMAVGDRVIDLEAAARAGIAAALLVPAAEAAPSLAALTRAGARVQVVRELAELIPRFSQPAR